MDFDRKALGQRLATAQRYHAGLTEEVSEYLEGRGITKDLAAKYLLGISDDIQAGWLSIPSIREGVGVMWFNYRRLDGGKPKYKAPGEKHLYNTVALDSADSTGEIAITEGELDAIVATERFGVPAVGIPGATQWTGNRHWREMFTGYQVIWVLADPDDAGKDLAEALLESLPAARLVKLPGDVSECWQSGVEIKEFMK